MTQQILPGRDILAGKLQIPHTPSQRVVLVGGCFDILHFGHITYLNNAKAEGDVLVVALENDAFIRTKKKRTPFHTQRQRAQLLTNLKSVDFVLLLPTMRTHEAYRILVERVKPHVIAVTAGDPLGEKKKLFAEALGAKYIVVNKLIAGLSSSTISTYARILHD